LFVILQNYSPGNRRRFSGRPPASSSQPAAVASAGKMKQTGTESGTFLIRYLTKGFAAAIRRNMPEKKPVGVQEDGVEVPYERLEPETLRNLIQEFVTRDGNDWDDAGGILEDKVAQVMRQLQNRKAKVVFDLKSQTANIVACP
jgi:hypothetical protein